MKKTLVTAILLSSVAFSASAQVATTVKTTVATPVNVVSPTGVVTPATAVTTQTQSGIVLSGTVESIAPDYSNFVLNYGKGSINVDTAGWQRTLATSAEPMLVKGQNVTVSGYLTNDLFAGRKITAQSLTLADTGENYSNYAQPQEYYYTTMTVPVDQLRLTGEVTSVMPDENAFVVHYDGGDVKVLTNQLKYNPLAANSHRSLRTGDKVMVAGILDDDLFNRRQLVATSYTKLNAPVANPQGRAGSKRVPTSVNALTK